MFMMHMYHYTFLGHQEIKKVLALVDSTVFGRLKCLHHVYEVNIHIHVHVCMCNCRGGALERFDH